MNLKARYNIILASSAYDTHANLIFFNHDTKQAILSIRLLDKNTGICAAAMPQYRRDFRAKTS